MSARIQIRLEMSSPLPAARVSPRVAIGCTGSPASRRRAAAARLGTRNRSAAHSNVTANSPRMASTTIRWIEGSSSANPPISAAASAKQSTEKAGHSARASPSATSARRLRRSARLHHMLARFDFRDRRLRESTVLLPEYRSYDPLVIEKLDVARIEIGPVIGLLQIVGDDGRTAESMCRR